MRSCEVIKRPGYRSLQLAMLDVITGIGHYGVKRWKSQTGYTVEQTIEKVINRQQGLGAAKLGFMWMEFEYGANYDFAKLDPTWEGVDLDDIPPRVMGSIYLGHEIELNHDVGNSGFWMERPNRKSFMHRFNGAADEIEQMGLERLIPEEFFTGLYGDYNTISMSAGYGDYMLKSGMVPGQKMLVMVETDWHTDYWGESDSEASGVMLYVSPAEMTLEEFAKCLDVKERELCAVA